MNIASRMSLLGTETAFEVMARAKSLEAKGKDIIYLQIGEPDFATPKHIVDGAIDALRSGHTHYSSPSGILPLKEAIADEVFLRRGVRPEIEQIVVTPGAKPIIFLVMLACIESGDEVIYPNPGFPIYESMINFAGGKAVPLPLREDKGFSFDREEFISLLSKRTKMIIINSPHNPTGGILSADDIDLIAKTAKDMGILVLTDEVYKNIIYGEKHHSIYSIAGMKDNCVLLDGFSKTYSMTGWRLGYGVMPTELASKIERLIINSNSCTSTFSQYAAVEALKGPTKESESMVKVFKKRRDFIVEGLNSLPGVSCIKPKGAFYVFPNVSEISMQSDQLEDYLLNDAGVAVLSGSAFGKHGNDYLRLSYANSIENIEKALERIRVSLAKI